MSTATECPDVSKQTPLCIVMFIYSSHHKLFNNFADTKVIVVVIIVYLSGCATVSSWTMGTLCEPCMGTDADDDKLSAVWQQTIWFQYC